MPPWECRPSRSANGKPRSRHHEIGTTLDKQKQEQPLIAYSENECTDPFPNDKDAGAFPSDAYRVPLLCQSSTYELTGYTPSGSSGRFQMSDFLAAEDDGTLKLVFDGEIIYEDAPDGTRQRRVIERIRTLFRRDDLGAARGNSGDLLAFGQGGALALPGESYKLAFTPGLLDAIYQRKNSDGTVEKLLPPELRTEVLPGRKGDEGGYRDLGGDGYWWIPSGRIFYHRNPPATPDDELAEASVHFFLARRFEDPFGSNTLVDYAHDLLLSGTQDALQNTVSAENDYRVLQPRLVTDPNGNRSGVAFDALGMVVGTTVMGKEHEPDGKPKGDSLDGFIADLTQKQIDNFLNAPDPHVPATDLLGKATTRIIYDLDTFTRNKQPAFTATLARETHVSDLKEGQQPKVQISFSYSDGFGREIQKKIQAEAGSVPQRNENGKIKVDGNGQGTHLLSVSRVCIPTRRDLII